jgi:F0F1-type ATP synthase beta subunit
MSDRHPFDDPVPRDVVLSLDEAFRVLEAIEDARWALREHGSAPGLQDELVTVIRMLHGRLGLDEGGVQ